MLFSGILPLLLLDYQPAGKNKSGREARPLADEIDAGALVAALAGDLRGGVEDPLARCFAVGASLPRVGHALTIASEGVLL